MATDHNTTNGHHAHPISMYLLNLVVLLILMTATVVIAQFQLGSLANNLIAMGIAVTKAILVVLFFMHVKFSTKLTQLWAMTGFIWVTLMTIILLDYGTRRFEPAPSWSKDPGTALPRTIQRIPREAEGDEGYKPLPGDERVIRPRQ